ncbi:MAG: hypothetical protein GSR79_00655 [Desulfurococcales archaeon]|nr:hypothetical protein [Desulfurococcales archaeon]
MAEKSYEFPFYELPEALVEEMLNECNELGNNLSISSKNIIGDKRNIGEKKAKY